MRNPHGRIAIFLKQLASHLEQGVRLCTRNVKQCTVKLTRTKKMVCLVCIYCSSCSVGQRGKCFARRLRDRNLHSMDKNGFKGSVLKTFRIIEGFNGADMYKQLAEIKRRAVA